MALSLAGLVADGTTHISDAKAINKTFPAFIKIMQTMGAEMDLIA
jgi:5-enolpyruvylshikimate-3-phosphate synthase